MQLQPRLWHTFRERQFGDRAYRWRFFAAVGHGDNRPSERFSAGPGDILVERWPDSRARRNGCFAERVGLSTQACGEDRYLRCDARSGAFDRFVRGWRLYKFVQSAATSSATCADSHRFADRAGWLSIAHGQRRDAHDPSSTVSCWI